MDTEPSVYLVLTDEDEDIEGIVVGYGTEADMVNLAANYDSSYELMAEDDLSEEQKSNWAIVEKKMNESHNKGNMLSPDMPAE